MGDGQSSVQYYGVGDPKTEVMEGEIAVPGIRGMTDQERIARIEAKLGITKQLEDEARQRAEAAAKKQLTDVAAMVESQQRNTVVAGLHRFSKIGGFGSAIEVWKERIQHAAEIGGMKPERAAARLELAERILQLAEAADAVSADSKLLLKELE